MAAYGDLWVGLGACLVGVSCSVLGCFTMLRGTSMLVDAISHAVLPGIVMAYLLLGSLHSGLMLLSAAVMGLVTSFAIEFMQHQFKLQSDSAIGVVFTFLFAVGLILTTSFAGMVDLDLDCVLFGDLAFSILDNYDLGGMMIPKIIFPLLLAAVLNTAFVVICYRPLMMTSFDKAFTAALGYSVMLWHYVFVGMVSLTTVVSFKAVGAILVVAFFVGPAAGAYLLSDRLNVLLWLSVLLSVLAAICGYLLSKWFNSSITGMMASVIGLEFMICLFIHLILRSLRKKVEVH